MTSDRLYRLTHFLVSQERELTRARYDALNSLYDDPHWDELNRVPRCLAPKRLIRFGRRLDAWRYAADDAFCRQMDKES